MLSVLPRRPTSIAAAVILAIGIGAAILLPTYCVYPVGPVGPGTGLHRTCDAQIWVRVAIATTALLIGLMVAWIGRMRGRPIFAN